MNHGNKLNIIWQNSFSQPLLANNRAHVWRANLDLPTTEIERLAAVLSVDEIARANKFHLIEHRRRFIAARAILRQLLGNYLRISPERIEFEYGNCGKPQLAASMGDNSLQFNVSHSQEYALYGFTNHHLIGVDLEYLREMENITELAKRFFAHREFQLIADFTGREQLAAFYQLWTAKEAYLKAMQRGLGGFPAEPKAQVAPSDASTLRVVQRLHQEAIGTGLSGSLTDIELSLDDRNSILLAIRGNIVTVNNWSMYHFVPAAN
ncbi:MAG: 4'-phosphopantetheinyl transferase superfamily protein [Cyanobacteria bacterium P01_A01_bin.84]